MTQAEILHELEKLPVLERLTVVETVLHLIRQDLQQEHAKAGSERNRQLAAAAEALLEDYASDEELTAFTALNGEDFYAQG
jgi:hypothetical protein